MFFVISAARDSRTTGIGYFPETLRSEYHGIRKVIEAYSRDAVLAGREVGNANGIALAAKQTLLVRVSRVEGLSTYSLML